MKNTAKKINAAWHKGHKMPKNPTFEQRIEWHLEHAKNCECRPIPEELKSETEKRSE